MHKTLFAAALVALLTCCSSSSSSTDAGDVAGNDAPDVPGDAPEDERGPDAPADDADLADGVHVDVPGDKDAVEDTAGPASAYTILPLAPTGDIQSIWGWDDTAIAVGNGGAILRRQGSFWTPMDSPTKNDLFGVFGVAAEDVYAVGAKGTILHWDGAAWVVVEPSADLPENPQYNAVWGQEGHLYVVGNGGLVLHKADDVWKKEDSAVTYDLLSVYGASLLDVYVGARGGTVLRRIGGAWSATQVAGGSIGLHALAGLSGNELWAGGDQGTIVVYEEVQWVPKLSNDVAARTLHAAWALSESDVWFVGEAGAVVHSEGTKWNLAEVAGPYFKNHGFYGLWGRTFPEGVEALAVGQKGAMLRYDGETWADLSAAPAVDINDVAGLSADDALAVGNDGLLLAWNGSVWHGLDRVPGKDLTSVAAVGNGYVAVASDGSVVHVNGQVVAVEDTLIDATLRGVCAGPGVVVAVGEKGRIYEENKDGGWDPIPSGVFDSLSDCAVGDGGLVVAVGDSGRMLEVTGDTAETLSSPTMSNLHRVSILGGNVYAVGDNGLLLRYDGQAFEKLYEEPGLFLYGVQAFDDRVVAAGWAGRVVVWDPQTGSAEKIDVDGAGVLLQVWGAEAQHQFVVGKKGRMVEYVEGENP
jgi:hypothetical protein